MEPSSSALDELLAIGRVLLIGLDGFGSCLRATVNHMTGSIGTSTTKRFLGGKTSITFHRASS
jgi:hypothetical protein